MNNWLFLRGELDKRTQKSIDDNDDMWAQLFAELHGDEYGYIYYHRGLNVLFDHCPDIIFSRGGFGWQADICKREKTAFKIRYGAGRRYMPEKDIKYDLILVDTEKQKQDVLSVFPHENVHLWIKPAAKHFKYMPEVEKEYDVCYIANGQQAHFKGVEWVYDTVPKDLRVLHLGYPTEFRVPENVTQVRVDRIDMPKWINKCKVGIVPYWNDIDSCPRVIPEMLACGLSLSIANQLAFWNEKYIENNITFTKEFFWDHVKSGCDKEKSNIEWHLPRLTKNISNYYQNNLSLQVSANHIKGLIEDARRV